MTTTLIINVLCDRVIYFTDDPAYTPIPSPYTWVAYTDEPLPELMKLGNCWSYRFRNGELKFADEIAPEERGLPKETVLLKRNKATLVAELNKQIDIRAKVHLASSSLSGSLRAYKLTEATNFIQTGKASNEFIDLAKSSKLDPLALATQITTANKIANSKLLYLESKRLSFKAQIEAADSPAKLEVIRRQLHDVRY